MKNLLFTALCCLSILFTACGDDDDGVDCVRNDFLGTYVGTTDCSDTPGTTSIIISAGAEANQLILTSPEVDENSGDIEINLDFPPLTVDGCNVTGELDFADLGSIAVTGELLDNMISLQVTGIIFEETVDCSFEGAR